MSVRFNDPYPMPRLCYFISHPNVVISPDVPVPRWPLSSLGRERMHASLAQPWVRDLSTVYCSTEQKAIDGAEILARQLGLEWQAVAELGENDRSATGSLPPEEFERMADAFFARPDESVRGWETAAAAQARIVGAVSRLLDLDRSAGALAIVSHGAVGTLLHCHLTGQPISRRWDQPANGGGNYFAFEWPSRRALSWWAPIDRIDP